MRQILAAFFTATLINVAPAQQDIPLPSWNEVAAKRAILEFVDRVTKEGGPDFVPPAERIAVFDNDGTLWCEQPIYVQFAFVLDRVKALAPQHAEWKNQEPFAFVLKSDLRGLSAAGEKGALELMAATHTGMTTDEFSQTVSQWIKMARHPKYQRPYTECVYQPMLELLAFLRASGFKTYIVSGGGVEFMRPWAEQVYGVPPEQVIGSSGKLTYELRGDVPVLLKLPEIDLIDDKAGKPVGIQERIGRRPIAAFGNSDGDYEMLRWTTADAGPARPRFGLIVRHTDGEREYAYDRQSQIGRLEKALDEANNRGWNVVDMQRDWKTIFPNRYSAD